MNIREELYKTLENDPFGLLEQKPKQSTHRDEVKMIIESFQTILEFYELNAREPDKNAQRPERSLAMILEGIREDENKQAILKEYDKFELLGT
ncbi:MAG: GIY-YIG nuclease family protein, partial [Campylobacterota bacterium]|nr:GIY-YIG nuclease family protein [Campylobacterota bacterium]